MHIQDPENLYRVMKTQGNFAKDYSQPWTFYILSGELKSIQYAISEYKLTDKSLSKYQENPFVLSIFSGNYRAVELIIQSMKVDFYHLTALKHTPLHIAAWSNKVSQVEYIKCLIHQRKLTITAKDKDSKNVDAFGYVGKNKEITEALSKSIEEIDTEKFVDENDQPLFKFR